MRKNVTILMLLVSVLLLIALPASATIHPIVESFDCANEHAFEHHPLGDVADPPGQTPSGVGGHPGVDNHSSQSDLRGFLSADERAAFGHKLDGRCGKVGQGS